MDNDRTLIPVSGINLVTACHIRQTDTTAHSWLPVTCFNNPPISPLSYPRTCNDPDCVNPAHIVGCTVVPYMSMVEVVTQDEPMGESFPDGWAGSPMGDYMWGHFQDQRTLIAVIDDVFTAHPYRHI